MDITAESFFEMRTRYHIALVQKYGERLMILASPNGGDFLRQLSIHDLSKFVEPERTPYVEITKLYRKDGSVPMTPQFLEATTHHVVNNRHHPEAWDKDSAEKRKLNKADRNALIVAPINALTMPDLFILEMVADWCAVAEERGDSPLDWANRNIGTRWIFSQSQEFLIRKAIGMAWR